MDIYENKYQRSYQCADNLQGIDIYKNLGPILKQCGALKFGDFTLASGKKSRYYIDIKKASTKPKILRMVSNQMSRMLQIHDIKADYIACVELGGVPIGTAVSLDTNIPLIIIRKEKKEHGLTDRIIGDFEKGKNVLFVEDVTTTGMSSVDAIQLLRNNGLNVHFTICVVDREEGSEDNLSKIGVTLIPLVKVSDILKAKNQ